MDPNRRPAYELAVLEGHEAVVDHVREREHATDGTGIE
jgi:hypothetical protein